MPSTPPGAVLCPACGARIETTVAGDTVCLACWLRSGLEGPAEAPTAEVPESLGVYQIERNPDGSPRVLGRGAMGVTYRARDVSLERAVALKLVKAELCHHVTEVRERFIREARAAASLQHAHVAAVYQFGIDEESGRCFCAMELVKGETLEERVRRSGPLAWTVVREIARQTASALIAAEKQGIVHRDLKPGNIMIEPGDDVITVKIIDFGLAKALGAATEEPFLTQGGFLGTPDFASPEQLRRAPVDARSDIYSLGVTLWYLLTGQLPPATPDEPLPLRQLRASRVPASLIGLLVSMLSLEPAARPAAATVASRLAQPRRQHHVAIALGSAILLGVCLTYFQHRSPPQLPLPTASSPPPAPAPHTVAVLPFANLSSEPGSDNIASGIHDALLTDLARVADLKVVSRTSVLPYGTARGDNLREIARQLGVAYIVEGTIQVSHEKLRLSAQLIDARTDLHQWAQIFDRPLDDLFQVESDVAQTVAEQLGARIAPNEKLEINAQPTHDLDAFKLYAEGNRFLSETSFSPRGKINLLRAAQLLGDAVGRDPDFLLAWCRLAAAHDLLYFYGFDRTPLRLSLAESAVNAAIKLRPDAGFTHLARARHLYQGYLAYEPALTELEMARKSLPNNAGVFTLAGYIYRRQGRWHESTREFENALALDPRNVEILKQDAISYNLRRQYADTAIVLDRALLIAPDDVELRLFRAQVDLNWQADTRPLHAVVATILEKNPAAAAELAGAWLYLAFCERDRAVVSQAIAALGDGTFGVDAIQFRHLFWEGLAARMNGDTAAAQHIFTAARAEQEQKVNAAPDFAPALCMLAVMDAALGRKEEAIREGRRAVELLPVSRDPVNGAHIVEFLAVVYAWSGEPALACEQLEAALKTPGTLSYGQLKLSPMWDDLRKTPRFEKIVAALAPNE